MMNVRQPAVAGMFYPAEAEVLREQVDTYLRQADAGHPAPKAVVAPHAGYIYSGPIAASAYAPVKALAGRIERVVLLGPAHRVYVRGLAASSAQYFDTPLGRIPLDRKAIDEVVAAFPFVEIFDQAHGPEHSLEVHLPFLQETLGTFSLVPFVVGDAAPDEVAQVLEALWGAEETLIVISSDLSHYHDYDTAGRLDRAAATAIEHLDPSHLNQEQACGRIPVCGLMEAARRHGLKAETVDLRNSGDTAGPRDQVVGYGAWLFY
jgi:AmmeMemoRadiSam system protein B